MNPVPKNGAPDKDDTSQDNPIPVMPPKKKHTDPYTDTIVVRSCTDPNDNATEAGSENEKLGEGENALITHSRGQVIPVGKIYQHRRPTPYPLEGRHIRQ